MEEQTLQTTQPEPRAFDREIQELLTARPELRGEELPQEVVEACIRGKSVTQAYNDYATAKKQSTRAAAAPVRGVTRGGSVQTGPEDAFLKGLQTEW